MGESLQSGLVGELVADQELFAAIRRDIHAHPELRYEEDRTSALIVDLLQEWGIETHVGLARTGVVGTIRAGSSDRAIGIRADMDALPLEELNQFAHASVFPGKMHACGHDGHVAMLLAAARHLARHRNFDGTVYLVFQPAEEGGGGARQMILDGLFDLFPMQSIYGLHNWPGLPQGIFAVKPGPVEASSNYFRVTVTGKGGHAAMPHGAIDPVMICSQLVQAFQTIISRNKHPLEPAVVSVTRINGGHALNIIPEICEIQGTVRAFTPHTLDLIETRMREIIDGLCAGFGATYDFAFDRKSPATINDPAQAEQVRQALVGFAGPEQVVEFEPTMGSEDFSYFLEQKPGCYFFLGNDAAGTETGTPPPPPCMLHNPHYDFNDALIPLGGTAWVRLVEHLLPPAAG